MDSYDGSTGWSAADLLETVCQGWPRCGKEHIAWALETTQPQKLDRDLSLDEDLQNAIDFELSASPEEIDAFRDAQFASLTSLGAQLKSAQETWCRDAHACVQPLVSRLYGPLFEVVAGMLDYHLDDALFVKGFSLDWLPPVFWSRC